METTTKAFDAVAESRKWRETTSLKLDAMTTDERVTYLRALGKQYASEHVSRHPKRAVEVGIARNSGSPSNRFPQSGERHKARAVPRARIGLVSVAA